MAMLLRMIGHEVRAAYDGPTGLDSARRSCPTWCFAMSACRAWTASKWPVASAGNSGSATRCWWPSPGIARKKTGNAPSKRASTPTWSSRSAWTPCGTCCLERRHRALDSLEAHGRIRPVAGLLLNPALLASREGIDPSGGLGRGRGLSLVLRDVHIQAGEGTEAPPTPGAKDSVPQPPAASLTVTEDRHGVPRICLVSDTRNPRTAGGIRRPPAEVAIQKRKAMDLLFPWHTV